MNTPKELRFSNLGEQLADFQYVNGKLFEEILPTASFDSKMRQSLLDYGYLDWSKISPAIFGSMFQSVMNPTERRNLGAYYTSETEADHITPWHSGGKTTAANCQMLCKDDNRSKSGK